MPFFAKPRALLVVISTAVACAFFTPRSARACSPVVECRQPVRTFGDKTFIPGNLIYFKVLVDEPGPLTLRKADGSVVPSSIRTIGTDRVFAPNESVAPDETLTLEYTAECPDPDVLKPKTLRYTFKTRPSGTPEMGPIGLAIQERGVANPDEKSGGAPFVRVRNWGPDRNGDLYHLIDTYARVEGGGSLSPRFGLYEMASSCAHKEPQRDGCGHVYEYPPGTHRVVVTTTVIGAEQQPAPAMLDVTISCDAPPSCDVEPSTSEQSPSNRDGGEAANGESSSGTSSDRPVIIDEIEEQKSDGCSVRAGQRGQTLSLLTLLSGSLLLAGMRRRKRA